MPRLLIIFISCILPFFVDAQTFYQITATGGTQTIGGKTVSVTSISSGSAGQSNACSYMTHKYGNGTTSPGGFLFSFSSPVYYIRMHFFSLDGPTSPTLKGDEANFWINGSPYMVNMSQVSIIPVSCSVTPYVCNDSPAVVAGKLTGIYNTTIYNRYIQLDIILPTPINSFQIVDTSQASPAFFANIYFPDTGIAINKPYTDTLKCPGDSLYLPYTTFSPFNSGNSFTAQLSNASGSFASPTTVGSLSATGSGTIGCKLPQNVAAGGGYRVRIVSSNPVRTSAPNDTDIHILAGPSSIPVAAANSPCAGSALNLTSTNAGTGVSYSWAGPGSFSSNVQNPSITSATTANSGDYIVTAGIGACSRKDTVTATVKAMPAVPTAGSNSPVCSGNDLNLTGASTTNGVSYNWSGPGGYNSTTQNPTRFNSTTGMSGTYSVTATLNGCTSAAGTTSVTVNQTPTTPIANSNSPVCAGASLNLTASSTTGASYSWTGPNGFTSTQQNPVVNPATMADGGTYDVTATLNGCTSQMGSTTVVINNVSSIAIYPSPSDSVCNNSPNVTFVAIPNNAGSSPQYQWYKNGTAITGATNLTYNATGIITNDTFQCRMTVTGLCSDPLILFSNKIGMTLLPDEAPPAISISASPGTLLSPWQTVTFTATPGGNMGAAPSYQWKRNGQSVIGATSNTWNVYTLSDNDEISCAITSSVLCAYPKTVESNKITIHIKTGIGDVEDEHINIYPNPVQDELIVEGAMTGTDIMISDIVGHTLLHSTASEKTVHINTAQLVKGNYLLQLSSAEGKRIVKLVK